MMRRFPTGGDFLKGIEGVPVTIDQWQLEKLALSARDKEVLYSRSGPAYVFIRRACGAGAFANLRKRLPCAIALA